MFLDLFDRGCVAFTHLGPLYPQPLFHLTAKKGGCDGRTGTKVEQDVDTFPTGPIQLCGSLDSSQPPPLLKMIYLGARLVCQKMLQHIISLATRLREWQCVRRPLPETQPCSQPSLRHSEQFHWRSNGYAHGARDVYPSWNASHFTPEAPWMTTPSGWQSMRWPLFPKLFPLQPVSALHQHLCGNSGTGLRGPLGRLVQLGRYGNLKRTLL